MAAGTGRYKRILQLLDKWPAEEGKSGRDLGEFLRNKINLAYKQDKFNTNQKYWDSQYISLQRLVNNDYKNRYPRALNSTATGLTAEQCKIALSNEFLQQLEEEDEPFYKKFYAWKTKSK